MVSVRLGFIATGQGVHLGVVEQAPGAVSPREALVADAHVVVRNELGPGLAVIGLVAQVRVDHAQSDRGDGHQVGQLLPQLVASAWKEGAGT